MSIFGQIIVIIVPRQYISRATAVHQSCHGSTSVVPHTKYMYYRRHIDKVEMRERNLHGF